ncbi:MAG: hypothetical protein RIR26_2472 [Pseudomonadota bacterium]|jgi:chemotaxis protein MotA
MRTFPIGFALMAILVSLSMGKESMKLYANHEALLMVAGGTIAILVMSSPAETLKRLFRAIRSAFGPQQKISHYQAEFDELMQKKSLSEKSENELINYAVELWSGGIEAELFVNLVSQKRDELERGYLDAVHALRNLAKYPPALGMTGTVMGLVSLLSMLGQNQEGLGPALALAMTATFFGLVLSNCLVTPLADHLQVRQVQNERLYTGIFQILVLIEQGEAPALIKDEVKDRAA